MFQNNTYELRSGSGDGGTSAVGGGGSDGVGSGCAGNMDGIPDECVEDGSVQMAAGSGRGHVWGATEGWVIYAIHPQIG